MFKDWLDIYVNFCMDFVDGNRVFGLIVMVEFLRIVYLNRNLII